MRPQPPQAFGWLGQRSLQQRLSQMMNIRIGKQFLLREQLLLIFIAGIWGYLLDPQTNPSLSRDCVVIGELLMVVILNPSLFVTLSEAKSLQYLAQGKLREESHGINNLKIIDSSAIASE